MKSKLLYTLVLLFTSLQAYPQIYTYDANNKLTKVEYGNGVTVSYEYDVLGNRTSKKVSGVTAQSFKVTVKASPKEYGSVDGGGTYSEGANVELNAVASVGFEFEKWSDGPTDNPRTITVTKDVSYTALFKVKEKNQEESGGEIGPGGVDLGIYDTNGDGVVNQYDLDAIIEAYLEDAPATPSTDLDDDGEITIADISMMVAIMNDMHTGEYNGHEYVDLGLPSGTLWATCNLGATSSEESGCYYAWGETTGSCEGKTDFSWRNYKYCNGLIGEGLTKYNNDPELGYEGYTDDLETLEPSDDAATANWGGKWRMPTREDINELRNKQYTKWTFATHNGVKGFVVTSIVKGYVGNSIFLPAEGGFYDGRSLDYKGEYSYYWASTAFLNSYGDYAKSIVLRASGTHGDGFEYRCEGLSIRPVVNLGEVATGSDPDLSNGLVAYYPFNGNANDESGHGNHGTPMSSVTLTTGVNGDANGAYKFGGCDNPGNIHIPNSESLIIDDGWSFATFVKPTSYTGMDGWGRKSTTDGMHAIMGKDHDQSGFSIQYRLNSDSLHVWLGCTSGWTKDFGASIYGNYLNQWVHVSITYSNSTFKVYLNGQKRAEAKIQANFSVANTKDLYLGKYRDSWYPMDGVLDEVRIYNRALSDDEIKQLAGEVNLNCPVAEAIDLGLPSGTKWASWNIGASSPEDCGGYYAWGETEEKDYYDWSTYTHCDGTLETCHHIGDNIAGTEYDVAHMKWGASWTMPSTDQIKELMDNCERTWTSQNGTNGMLFTGPNGNSIFLPAAGWRTYDDLIAKRDHGDYWSSELNKHHEYCADGMGFESINCGWFDSKLFHGRSVRAVISPEKTKPDFPVAEAIDLGLPSGTKWASWNVGASAPEEYGGYYAWGETEEKDYYEESTYKYYNPETNEYIYIGDDISGTEYDVAHVKWGGSWRMPTCFQQDELRAYCTKEWAQQNGVNGIRLTGPNGNSIFLPATGYRRQDYLYAEGEDSNIWSSSLSSYRESNANYLDFFLENWERGFGGVRHAGFSVRAVIKSEKPHDNCPVAEAIDLGLPSGTKWASWNIGASAPEEYGGYYAWGETEENDYYSWGTYMHCDGSKETCHHIGDDISGTEYDVAHMKWGGSWRMPSIDQLNELRAYCTKEWTQQNGVDGIRVTGPNGNSIFLPAAGTRENGNTINKGKVGDYWSSSLHPYSEQHASEHYFHSDGWNWMGDFRYRGQSVRAVINPEKPHDDCPVAEAIDLGLPSGTKWASWNVGASAPEEYGGYYAWGETEEKDNYFLSSYSYYDRNTKEYVNIGENIAGTQYDVAHVKWGGLWRMPSIAQIEELRQNCTSTWTQLNGVNGLLLTGPNGNTIFLPAAGDIRDTMLVGEKYAGWCWSSISHNQIEVRSMYFHDEGLSSTGFASREGGLTVRAVMPPEYALVDPNYPIAEAIDLGLPSGTKWASWNIGASSPEGYGGFYAWGETEEKNHYDWNNYIHCDGSSTTCHNIGDDIAGTEYDVAHVKWGGSWRMPSEAQIRELKENCTHTWIQLNNVNGMLFTGPNGKTIFLPAAGICYSYYHEYTFSTVGSSGDYWTSSLTSWGSQNPVAFYLYSNFWSWNGFDSSDGRSVRAVCK